MCKYCDCKIDQRAELLGCRGMGEQMVDTHYTACNIQRMSDGSYCIYAAGDDEGWTEPISYCPFCGRKLKE